MTMTTMQEHVYQTDVHSIDELKQWLMRVWCNLDQDIIDANDVKEFKHVWIYGIMALYKFKYYYYYY